MTLEEPLKLPARKPRRVPATITYVGYRALRRVVPHRAFLRFLLAVSWALDRAAYEQALAVLGLDEGMKLFRPHTIPFLQEHVRTGDSVLELGSGPGVFTPTLAACAASVLCVDADPAALAVARRRSKGLNNVSFSVGNGPEAADEGFDTAVLLHVLEHMPDPVASLASLPQRCNQILIEVPDLESIPGLHIRLRMDAPVHWDDDHRSEFTAATLTSTMERAGWQATTVEKRNRMLLAVGERPS